MDGPYSPRSSKIYAEEVDAGGAVIDEDEDTYPVGYRYLHSTYASKAVLPRHSTFVSKASKLTRNYHSSHTVLTETEFSLPANASKASMLLQHIIWALKHEVLELQILKMTILNTLEDLCVDLQCCSQTMLLSREIRMLWFFIEFWTDAMLNIPDVEATVEPFLLFDPELYVTGPCYGINKRQMYNFFILCSLTT